MHEIINALNIIMPQWIKFPVHANDIEAIQQQRVVIKLHYFLFLVLCFYF